MKTKLILLFVLVSVSSLLNSVTWEIKQDGTGNFTTIQAGIVAASNADTILVFPGIYLENVDYLEKSITLASLYLTTGDDEYVNQTIIDGNESGSCVEIRNCTEEYNTICGFTLRNGTGNQLTPTYLGLVGGGFLIYGSHVIIDNCIIRNNVSEHGGGIYCHMNSSITLKGTDIKFNCSYKNSGGIVLIGNSEILFDNNDLCNMYLNYSSTLTEISKSADCPPLDVIVDTFTVMDPGEYFLGCYDTFGNPVNDITLSIQNAKLEPVDADLYVAADGDNTNSGLTPEEPLATINYACTLIQPDSLENNTIFVADGVYSTSLNDQWFPLQMRSYTNLIGQSMDNTILDAEFDSPMITDVISEINYTIKNFTLINGYGVSGEGTGIPWSTMCIEDARFRDKWVILENIKSYNCEANSRHIALWFLSAYLKNVHVYDNLGNANIISSLAPFQNEFPITVEMENCSLKNCDTDGFCFLFGSQNNDEYSKVVLKNVEVTDNYNTDTEWPTAFSAVVIDSKMKADMINCTIGYNRSEMSGGAIGCIGRDSELNIYNSIVYENDPKNLYIRNDIEDYPFVVNIYNSLFDHGELSIQNGFPWNIVNWMDGNLESDPLWQESGEYPYMLTSNSPCIDAGTLDLPAGIELPEYDLAGNPRIVNGMIDMGAYEWQGTGISNNQLPIINTKLSNYPNPFNPSTTISFSLANEQNIELIIYNIKGQKVKDLSPSLCHPELVEGRGETKYSVTWDGIDETNNPVSSGVYMYQLKVDDKTVTSKKMLLLK